MTLSSLTTFYQERQNLLTAGVIFVVYLAVAQLGYTLYTAPTVVTPLAGVVLAILFLYGLEYTPIIFLAATLSYVLNGASPGALLVLPLAQTLQAAVGVYVLKVLGFSLMLNRLRDVLVLMFVALVVSTIVPTLGLVSMYINATFFERVSSLTWSTWWVGMITSTLIVFPFVVRWVGKPRLSHRTFLQYSEATLAILFIVGINYVLFWTKTTQLFNIPLVYVLLVPFFWIALRIGPRFMTLGLILTTTMGIAGTFVSVMASPTAATLGTRLFQSEIFFNIIAVIFFILVTLEEERKRALSTLNEQVDELEIALRALHSQDRMKSEFLAVLAHELRNPLAPLLSSLEVLKLQGLVNEAGEGVLGIMDNQLRRMRRLLDDLLDIARISQQKLTLQKALIDVNSVINDSFQSVKSIIEGRGQQLVVLMPQETIMVEADATRLEQACINLLNNASKFSKQGSIITLSVKRVSSRVEVSVRDEGIGIEPQFLDYIFQPFQQGRSPTSNDGMGVGLTLAKNIVEMHGGTLGVQSEGKNLGSEFTISLPIAPAARSAFIKTIQEPQTTSHVGKFRVLVVDDNEPAAQGIATLLKIKGYLTECAFTGKEAEQKMTSFEPHAVVLDIGLPDTDGYTLAKFLRTEGEFKGPLIALTGYGQEQNKKDARDAGFDVHLTKPVGIADLHSVLALRLQTRAIQ